MAQYVGKRIVPRHDGVWDQKKAYENLVIVLAENGDSYISRKVVPAGTPLSNGEYWALSGRHDAQLKETYDQMTSDMKDTLSTMNQQFAATKQQISEELGQTRTYVSDNLAQTTNELTEQVTQATQRMDQQTAEAVAVSEGNKTELQKRMDVIEKRQDANVSASTDSNADYAAEVVDARVDVDGVEHNSAGSAIRSQVQAVKTLITEAIDESVAESKLAMKGEYSNRTFDSLAPRKARDSVKRPK